MSYLSILARATGIGIAIYLLGRAIRTAHRLDRTASILRWSVLVASAILLWIAWQTRFLPDGAVLGLLFIFTIFLLPDISYYLVSAVRSIRAHAKGGEDQTLC